MEEVKLKGENLTTKLNVGDSIIAKKDDDIWLLKLRGVSDKYYWISVNHNLNGDIFDSYISPNEACVDFLKKEFKIFIVSQEDLNQILINNIPNSKSILPTKLHETSPFLPFSEKTKDILVIRVKTGWIYHLKMVIMSLFLRANKKFV